METELFEYIYCNFDIRKISKYNDTYNKNISK